MVVDENSRSSTLASNDPTSDALELIRSKSDDSSSFTAFWSTIVETCATVVDDNVNSVKKIMPTYSTPAHFLRYDDEKYGDSNDEIYSPLLDDPTDDDPAAAAAAAAAGVAAAMTVNSSSRDDVPTTTFSSKSSLSYYDSITSFIDDAIRIAGVSTAWEEEKEADGGGEEEEEEEKKEEQPEQEIIDKTIAVKQGDKDSVLQATAADAASPYFDDNQYDGSNNNKKKKENCECNVVGCTVM